MKKTIVIEILLLFVFSVLFAFCVIYLNDAVYYFNPLRGLERLALLELIYGLIFLIAAIVDLVVMFLIATRDIPKLKQAIENRKQRAAARKEAKKQADKRKRIEELQAELDELQDKTNSNS